MWSGCVCDLGICVWFRSVCVCGLGVCGLDVCGLRVCGLGVCGLGVFVWSGCV